MEYHVSDVALRNNKEIGYWIILDDGIYDVSHFMEKHPGGSVILMNSAGRDASAEFKSVMHQDNPRIKALLKMLYVGRLRAVSLSSNRLQVLYGLWLELHYLVLEMENTLRSDLSFLSKACTFDDHSHHISPYKIDLLLETHSRFVNGYLSLTAEKLEKIKVMATDNSRISLAHAPIAIVSTTDMSFVIDGIAKIRENNATVRRTGTRKQNERWDAEMRAYRVLIEDEDTALLAGIKREMINGLKVFESNDIDIAMLIPIISNIREVITNYSERIETRSRHILVKAARPRREAGHDITS